MTKSTITREQAQKIIVAADEVITALAGTNEEVHPDDSKKMCELWDGLNDRHAPPVVVRELARMALAAMDSEPVAEVCEDYALRYISHGPAPKEGLQPGDKLYRHAQPAPEKYNIGDATMRHIFTPTGMTNVSDMQAVFDRVEAVLVGMDQPAPVVTEALQNLRTIVADPRRLPRRKEWIGGQQYSYVLLEEVEALVEDACRAAMLAASPQSPGSEPAALPGKWIPVSERMPEKNQTVLISVNFDSSLVEPLICTARYTGSTFRRGDATVKPGSGIEQATHWMPLPAAPEEVKGE